MGGWNGTLTPPDCSILDGFSFRMHTEQARSAFSFSPRLEVLFYFDDLCTQGFQGAAVPRDCFPFLAHSVKDATRQGHRGSTYSLLLLHLKTPTMFSPALPRSVTRKRGGFSVTPLHTQAWRSVKISIVCLPTIQTFFHATGNSSSG